MSYQLIVRPEAEIDVEEAFRWYELQKSGLGREFVLRLDACLASIQRSPFSYPIKYKKTRRALLRRFPFSVVYTIDADAIVVIAVFHAKRNPQIWQDRI